ncbi:MAG: LamG-like jellyroll fold domain-containing protein [Candidatus Ozemobacteraceae bacterium]
MKRIKDAFTLLEMLVVVLVIGVLTGAAVPKYHSFVVDSRRGRCLTNLKSIEQAISIWEIRNQRLPSKNRFRFRFQPMDGTIFDEYGTSPRMPSRTDVADIIGDSVAFVCPDLLQRYGSQGNIPADPVTSYFWVQRKSIKDAVLSGDPSSDWDQNSQDFGAGETRNAICPAFGRPYRGDPPQSYSSLPESKNKDVPSSQLTYLPYFGPDYTLKTRHYDRMIASTTSWYVSASISNPTGTPDGPFTLYPKGVSLTISSTIEENSQGLNPKVTDILANGNKVLSGSANQYTPPNPGEYILVVRAKDDAGNIKTSDPIRIRIPPPPTVAMYSSTNATTSINPILMKVTFNVPVTEFDANDIDVAGAAVENFAPTPGDGEYFAEYSFGLKVPSSNNVAHNITANISAGKAQDRSKSWNTAAPEFTRYYQPIPPWITISTPSVNLTATGPVTFTVTFHKADFVDLRPEDIVASLSGTANVQSIDNPLGTGTETREIELNSIIGDGKYVGIKIAGDPAGRALASDSAGNVATATIFSPTFEVDNTRPTGQIKRFGTTPTNSNGLLASITFSEPVFGFTTSSLSITNASASIKSWPDLATGPYVGYAAGPYTFSLTPVAAQCYITISMLSDRVRDRAGNKNSPIVEEEGVTHFEYDSVRPTVQLSTTMSVPIKSDPASPTPPIPIKAQFDEDVVNFDKTFIMADYATINNVVESVSKRVWTFNVTPTVSSGTIIVRVSEGVATDRAGNYNYQATPLELNYYQPHLKVKVDDSSNPGDLSYTNMTLETNISIRDHDINGGEPVSHYRYRYTTTTWSSWIPVSDPIKLTSLSEGFYRLEVVGRTPYGTDYIEQPVSDPTAWTWTVDRTAPCVASMTTPFNPVSSNSVIVTASFTENVVISATDSTVLSASATIKINGIDYYLGAAITNFIGTGSVYTFKIATGSTSVDATFNVKLGSGVVKDYAGNPNVPYNNFSVRFDNIKPSALLSTTVTSPTNSSPIPVILDFDEEVLGFNKAAITANNATISNIIETLPKREWTFNVTPTISSGVVSINLIGSAGSDLAGNPSNPATSLGINYYKVFPKVVLSNLPASATWVRDTNITVNSLDANNEPISQYQYQYNTTSWSGWIPVSDSLKLTSLPEASYTLRVIGKTTYGIEQSTSDPTTCSWAIDFTKPRIISVTTPLNPASSSPIIVTASFTEKVIILATDSTVLSCASATITNFTGTGSVYTFSIVPSNVSLDAVFNVNFGIGVARDAAGNLNEASSGYLIKYDVTPPIATFLSKPNAQTFDRFANFVVGGFEVVQYKYKLDSGTWSSAPVNVADPLIFNYLAVGTHTAYIIGCDLVGNWQATTSASLASFSWHIKPVYVSPIAGIGTTGLLDGKWYSAKFMSPRGLAKVGTNLYVADNGIRIVNQANGMVGTPRPDMVKEGLVLNLDADNGASYPGNGSIWYDLSGNNNNAALGSAIVTSTPSYLNSGGTTQIAATSILNTDTHSIFFALQFNPTSAFPSGYDGAWNKIFGYEPSGSDRSPGIWRYPSQRYIHWRYDPGNVGIDFGKNSSNQDFDMDTWYIVGVTKNGAAAKAYVNGKEIQSGTVPNPKTSGISGIRFYPGYRADMSKMSFCQVYNRPLSASEVLQNYNASPLSQLSLPVVYGLTSDGSGNLFSTSIESHVIRQINQTTQATTILAGKDGTAGFRDDQGVAAIFNGPRALAYYSGFLYVADTNNHLIRAVNVAGGAVNTLAGAAGSAGSLDGGGGGARFNSPYGITADSNGNLYVADTGNHTIRKIVLSSGQVTTIAGTAGQSGYVDGVGAAARFSSPYGVAADSVGNVMVTDYGNKVIRKISQAGVVTTVAGAAGVAANAYGVGGDARFQGPYFIMCEDDNGYFIADYENFTVKKLTFLPYAVLRNTPGSITNSSGVVLTNQTGGSVSVDGGGLQGYKYSLDGVDKGEKSYGVPITFSGLADGAHILSVLGKGIESDWQDAAKPTVFSWNVDTTPPVVALATSTLPANGYRDTFALITVVAASGDEAESYQYNLDNAGWTANSPIAKPISLTDLQPGAHAILVRGTDLAGNLQTNAALYASYAWSIAPTYINTLAGMGSAGFNNGRPYDAKFSNPRGAFRDGSSVYISDSTNNIIRKISLDTYNVSTVDKPLLPTTMVRDGLILCLDASDENSYPGNGTTWYDLSGNENHGTLSPGVTYSSNEGGSLVFDGANEYVDLNIKNLISGVNPFTIEVFYNNTPYNTGCLIGNYGTGYTLNSIWVFSGGLYINTGSGYIPNYSSRVSGKHCITVTRDAAGYISAYFDTKLESSNVLNKASVPVTINWRIGADVNGAGEQFSGNIYSIKAYDHALSESEVQQNFYASPLAQFIPPAPVFSGPQGVAVYDSLDGNGPMLYVADMYNNVIRKVNPQTLENTVFAGRQGSPGTVDGLGDAARFYNPVGIVAFSGFLYVSDYAHHAIRKVHIASRDVSTLAGAASAGSADGNGTSARFNNPTGLAIDSAGSTLYVADFSNHTIRKIDLMSKNVTTFAGAAGISGSNSGCIPSLARFNQPVGLAFDSGCGRMFISEYGNSDIRMVNFGANLVMTVAGKAGETGYGDSTGGSARFKNPHLMTTNTGGNDGALIGEPGNNVIRTVTFEPLALFRNVPPSSSNQTTIDVSVVGAGLTGYRYKFDADVSWTEILTGQPIHKTGLTEGQHALQVIGKGVQGEWQQDVNATTAKWKVDLTPPVVVLSNLPPTNDRCTVALITVAAKAGDEAYSYQYKFDSDDWSADSILSKQISLTDVQPGTHTILVRGTDLAGNQQTNAALYASYTWLILPTYVNTLAGMGSAGLNDGRLYDAKFSDPTGAFRNGSSVYIGDRANNVLRKISLDTSIVSTIDPGKYALQFNGLNNYLSIPHVSYFDSTSVTVELWFTLKGDPNTDANNNWRSLIRMGSTAGTGSGWDVVLEEGLSVAWDVGLGGVSSRMWANVGMKLNVPVHMAFVYDASTGDQLVYANGVLAATKTNAATNITTNSEPVIIAGGVNTGNFPNGAGFSPGKYCNIRIWNVARTAAEILAYYRGGLPNRPTGMIGSYRCNEGSGLSVLDDSGYAPTGTLVNSPQWVTTDVPNPLLAGPYGVAMYDSLDGNGPMLYVADYYNNVIQKVNPQTSETTVFAGRLGAPGTVNGVGDVARLYSPMGIVALNGYLYVSDWSHHTIRKIHIASRDVSTLAGAASAGAVDANGTSARFRNPGGLAIDSTGSNLYVADYSNHTIRKIDLQSQNVTTFAGAAGIAGSNSGCNRILARFNGPWGLAFNFDCKKLLISEYLNHDIRMIDFPTNLAMTIAGKDGTPGYGDGTGGSARFKNPTLMTTNIGGNEGAIVGERSNNVVRILTFEPLALFRNIPPPYSNQTTVNISVVGAGLTGYRYKFDSDTSWTEILAGSPIINKTGLAEGLHTLQVIGRGVQNEWQKDVNAMTAKWTVDITPPIAALSNIPTNPTYDLVADIGVAGKVEAVVRYKYKFDSLDWTASTSYTLPITLRDLAPGTHTLLVVGQDEAGNWQSSDTAKVTSYTWLIKPIYISTMAGEGTANLLDGKWYDAKLNYPVGVAKSSDTLYIPDFSNKAIRSVNLTSGEVKTVAGSPVGGAVLSFDGSDDFAQAPSGTYFSGDFSILAWVYVRNFSSWSRVIDFGNGPNSDNILLAITNGTSGQPNLHIFNGGTASNFTAPSAIPLNQWVHLAATLQGSTAKIYVNGTVVVTGTLNTPRNITRNRCYIGRSNWGDPLANAFMSDLSIWSTARTADDIQSDMNSRFLGNEPGLVAYWPMADQSNSLIDLSPSRLDATLFGAPLWMENAGPPIISGDGVGAAARFKNPSGMAIGNDGKLYVADYGEHTIRKIDPATRLVLTYAGGRNTAALTDGTGLAARFNGPFGITAYDNYLFVAEGGNNCIRRIDLSNAKVTLFAGSSAAGSADGAGLNARFNTLRGIAQSNGILYVPDYGNNTIRKVDITSGVVTTLAGSAGVSGFRDGIGAEARFNGPCGIEVDPDGNLFVTEWSGQVIRKVSPAGNGTWRVTTVAGKSLTTGRIDGLGMDARFKNPYMMTKDGAFGFFFADGNNNQIRKISLQPWVNLANTPNTLTNDQSISISVRGGGLTAYCYKLDTAAWSAEKSAGANIFEANIPEGAHTLLVKGKGQINDWQPDAGVTKLVWTIDLTPPTATLGNRPASSTLDDMTSIQVGGVDVIKYKYLLQKMVDGLYPSGAYGSEQPVASPLALTNLAPGTYTLSVIGRDTAGNWQSQASPTQHIWFVKPVYVTTVVGNSVYGLLNGQWFNANFRYIISVAVGNDGSIYMCDYYNNCIRKCDPAGMVTTLAGPKDQAVGYRDGPGEEVLFYNPHSITLSDDSAYLYVGDYSNQVIRKVDTKTGYTTTFAGTPLNAGNRNGDGNQALFYSPSGVTIWNGFLYVMNVSTCIISRVDLNTAQVSTLAGAWAAGFVDGDGTAARFYNPYFGDAADGFLYNSDYPSHAIRKTDLTTAKVTTLAGIGIPGRNDGPPTVATFYNPYGVAVGSEYVYVADCSNHSIRRINKATGDVAVLAGSKIAAAGNADDVGNKATFYNPYGICTDAEGNIFVTNWAYHNIKKITFTPWVALANTPLPRTNAISANISVRGGGIQAYKYKLDTPLASGSWSSNNFGMSVTIARSDLNDEGKYTLSVIGQGAVGEWQSTAKPSVYSWYVDRTPPVASISNLPASPYWGACAFVTVSGDDVQQYKYIHTRPTGIIPATTTYSVDDPIQLADLEPGSHTIEVMGCDTAGNWQSPGTKYTFLVKPLYVSTVAGEGSTGTGNGKWYEAQFTNPSDLCFALNGDLLVADGSSQQVRRIEFKTGLVSTFYRSSVGEAAAIDRDNAGNIYVACGKSDTNILRLDSSGSLLGTITGFNGPFGIAYDNFNSRNQLYALEYTAKRIQKVFPGTWEKQVVQAAGLAGPRGITVASTSGNILTAGFDSHHIMWVTSGGVISSLAGREKFSGSVDDIATAARFLSPSDVTIAGGGTIYIADSGNNVIRRLVPGGQVTTYAGGRGELGDNETTADSARFNNPFGVVEAGGDLFVADSGAKKIKRISLLPWATLRNTPPTRTPASSTNIIVGGGGVTGYKFKVDGQITQGWSAEIASGTNIVLSSLASGTYTLSVLGKGVASPTVDWQASATTYMWQVDPSMQELNVILNNKPANPTYSLTTDILATGAAVVSYVYRIDSGSWSSIRNVADPIVYQGLAPGSHTIEVKGIDKYGNRQASPTAWTWVINPTYVTTVAGSLAGYVNDKWYSSRMYEPMGLALSGNDLVFVDRVNRAIRKMNLPTGIVSTIGDSKWAVLSLDGIDDRIDFGNPANLHTLGDQTIEMWLRPGAWRTDNGYQILFYKYYAYEGMLALYMNGQLIYWYGIGSTYSGWWGGSGITAGVWNHIALVRDLSHSPMQVRFYVGGKLLTTVSAPYPSAAADPSPFYMFYGWNPNFKGEVADLRLWEVARTTEQIASSMNMLLTGAESGLKGYWPMFDGYGDKVLDMTTNKNPGTLVGNPTWSDTPPPFTTQSGGMGSGLNLNAPFGLVVATGCAYFADYNRHVIYKTDLTTKMTTVLAGAETQDGSADGTGPTARFRNPTAVAFDGVALFVADYGNHTIRKVTFEGVVTTHAGLAGSPGSANGTSGAARFNYPMGLAANRVGSLFVADSGNQKIRKIIVSTGVVTTLAGCGTSGRVDGVATMAMFNQPVGVAAVDATADTSGNILVSDGGGQTLRLVATSGTVITVAGVYDATGNVDGNGHQARFNQPFYLNNAEADSFFLSDRSNNLIRKVSFHPRVTLSNTPPLLTGKNLDIQVNGGGVTNYKYRIDSGAWGVATETPTSARINRNDMTDGNHTLEVKGKGINNEWQLDAVAEKFQWSVDTIPPTVVLTNLPSNPTQDRIAMVIATGTDVVQYRYRLDSGAYSDPTYPSVPIRLNDLSYGPHTLDAIGIDTAGNWQTTPTTATWTVKPLYVSLIAGKPDSSGLTNGKWYDAQFMEPSGLVNDGSDLYIVGGGNQTVRRFKTSTLQVENYWGDNNISPLFPEESLEFNGTNAYVSVPHNTVFNSNSVTIEMWFTLTSDPNTDANANWRSLIRKGNTSSTPTGWDVVIEDNKTLTWDVGLGATSRLLNVDVGLTVGNPVHLAFVYDANTGNQYVYANGVQKGSKSNSATGIVNNSESISFAQGTNSGGFPNGSGYTPGRFANIRLWNTARTQEQISTNMSRQLMGNEAGLAAYWPLSMLNGLITRDIWLGIAGGNCTDLTNNSRFPDNPDTRDQLSAFDVPQSSPVNVENFGTRIYGWINPPQTGSYNFYMCTDDGGKLFLSTDGTPTNKRQICGETWAWGYKNWFASTAQKSPGIDLVAGQLYFIEGIQKEAGGGDHIVVGWTGPGMTGTPQVISGSNFSTYAFRDITSNGNHGTLYSGPTWVNGITYRRFDTHGGIVHDGNFLYLAARDTHTIRKIDITNGQSTILAGVANQIGASDGNAVTARFNMPTSLVKVGSFLYVTDFGNHTIRKVNYSTGDTTTLAGKVGSRGLVDSAISNNVQFSGPHGITTDGTYLYVTDAHNHVIRRMAMDGSTTTYAGQGKMLGNVDGDLLTESRFFYPTGIQRDGNFLYVVNEGNHTLRRIDVVRSIVTTVAGKSGTTGNTEGVGVDAKFNTPHSLTPVDGEPGTFFLSDNHTVRKIAPYPVATLKNLPDDPTNNTSVGIVVYGGGVMEYKYKVQRGATLISDWSTWRTRTDPISLTTETAGQYIVTVRGRSTTYGDEQPEAFSTVFSWAKSANMALGKSVNQSSDAYSSPTGIAAKAVDGNRSPLWSDGSVTHTKSEAQPWWQVDLEAVSYISKIRIWNRADGCEGRLNNFYVLVSDSPFSSTNLQETINQAGVDNYYFPGTVGVSTEFQIDRTGRYVRIHLAGNPGILSLAEVEIMEGVSKNITSFKFEGFDPTVIGFINEKSKTISLLVPTGTDRTALKPTITHSGTSLSPDTGAVQDFTSPVTYTVKDADGNTRAYIVTVDNILRDGLVLHLDAAQSTSYPGSGNTWTDISGNNNNGTLTNGPTYSSANGGSIVFDGIDDHTSIRTSSSLNPSYRSLTVSMWFKMNSVGTLSASILCNKENLYETSAGGGYFTYAWQPHWAWDGDTSFPVNVGIWYNATVVYDKVKQYVYKNGILVYSRVQAGDVGESTSDLGIGARGLPGAGYSFLPGNVSNTMIYNRALPASEVLLNYNALKSRYSSDAKAINEFNFAGLSPAVIGVVNEASKTITLVVPFGTNVKALVPTIRHTGASVSPNAAVAQDFTNHVTYTVKDAYGNTQAYVVTVDTIVRSGLILYLDAGKSASYSGSGNTWTDLSGYGNNGTLVNGPTYSSENGGTLVFDGTNDLVNVTQALSTPISVSCWVKLPDLSKIQNMHINTNPHPVLGLSLNRTGTGNIYAYIGDGSGWQGGPGIISSINMQQNKWHNVTYTASTKTSTLYLDGVSVGTCAVVPSGWGTSYSLGSLGQVTMPDNYSENIKGNLATTYIYNRDLSASEVLINYNALKSRYSSDAKAITEFNFAGLSPAVTGVINEAAKTVTLIVPNGTSVTALVPTVRHTGASISPNTGVAQNFTSPVTYTVTAAGGTTQAYVVNVYKDIVQNGLVLNIDAGKSGSYPGYGDAWADLSGYGKNGTLFNGPTYDSANGGSIVFDGIDDGVSTPGFGTTIQNNFSMDIWFMPKSTYVMDAEATSGSPGTSGKKYLLGAAHGGDTESGAGISAGTNGVSVYEHGSGYMPALLAYSSIISTSVFSHIVVTYENKQPKLYFNGSLVRTGLTSLRTNVNLVGSSIGYGSYGNFNGSIAAVKFYNRTLSASEVQQNYNALKFRFGM